MPIVIAKHKSVDRGNVSVADIKFPLPYRPKSFSLVIVSDTLDYLSLDTSIKLFLIWRDEGFPTNLKAKVADVSKFGRAVTGFYIMLCYLYMLLSLTLDLDLQPF
ncbi:hypothetical protein MtrunA17_Chr3g0140301 [Medicago truncatula]|uniref:Uncharacterized protein n=1 Tax=Medicago truncatula TaxID=3880 RepID=A0A396J0H8_MEDTR|nr:hypothetical protein MtrunA17_Chr3g0140301 [Medicago truncatula]